jgi:sulfofructose kinase
MFLHMTDCKDAPQIVCVGTITLDAIALVDAYPGSDSRTIAQNIVTAGGGPAATAAVAAARAGCRVALVGSVGVDDAGARALEELVLEGIDVSGVQRDEHGTASSVVVVNTREHGRAIITQPRSGPATLSASAKELIAAAPWVHVDQLGWTLIEGINRTGKLSIDAGNPIPGFVGERDLPSIDLYVPTIEQLHAQYAIDSNTPAREVVEKIGAYGPGAVVATDGSRGCWYAYPGDEATHVPVASQKVLSTLGAGDVFHGALVAAVAAGNELRHAVAFAAEVATASCEGLDGRSAIPYQSALTKALHDA